MLCIVAHFSKECFGSGLMYSMTKIDDPWSICLSQTGALLLEGDTLKYFGANIPVNLAAAVIAEVVLVGGAEYYRSTNKSPLGSVRLYPMNCHGIAINFLSTQHK